MHNQFTTNLLSLTDVIVEGVKHHEDFCEVFLSQPVRPHKCPRCGSVTSKIHDYRVQKIKDIPILNKPLILSYRKRRYKCKNCRKNFYETVSFVGRYQRMTPRLVEAIIDRLRTNFSMCSIAKDFGVSACTITRIFDYVSYKVTHLPEVLSIDEFKGTTEKGKYHCVLVDPVQSKVLDIIDKRSLDYLLKYFSKFKERQHVKYVVIDMWAPYKQAVKQAFPQARIVIDRFHYIRNCIWALDKVRKNVQQCLPYEKARFLKYSKRLLLSHPDNLSNDGKLRLANILLFDERIRLAYVLKEKFMDFVRSKDKNEAEKKLSQWLQMVNTYKINEFSYLAKTILNWKEEILNSFTVPYTNACIEGFNNKIKVIKRNAFGFRNFSRFRTRILHCCS
ncbi:MAG: ISL3 family transposase [Bacillota bacterium]